MTEPYYQQDGQTIYLGDCREVLPTLSGVSAVVTDPPYGLEFMGKDWDHGIPGQHFWELILEACLPGAMCLAFGGTRTYHRLVCAIEDAGFEIRDCIQWIYGSGFPKSLDISKAIDKANGRRFEDRYAIGRHIRERREALGLTRKEVNSWFGYSDGCEHWERQDEHGARVPTVKDWAVLKNKLELDDNWQPIIERIEAEREVVGNKTGFKAHYGGAEPETRDFDITTPSTEHAKIWNGYGTALKPAHEPICVAMKPLVGTYAENAIEHGVAGINVDGCRVGTEDQLQTLVNDTDERDLMGNMKGKNATGRKIEFRDSGNGRWPANIIHDGSDEVVRLFPESNGGTATGYNWEQSNNDNPTRIANNIKSGVHFGDSGSAARFFYTAKASGTDRGNKPAEDFPLFGESYSAGLDGSEIVYITLAWENEVYKARLRVATERSAPRVIGVSGVPSKDVQRWNTLLFGNGQTGQSLAGNKYTTATETPSTTTSQTWNFLTHSLTKDCTQDVLSGTGLSSSPAESAEPLTLLTTITSGQTEFLLGAAPATSRTLLQISASEGNCGERTPGRFVNFHSTVKPLALMSYLVKLVTMPERNLLLDPFAGSGSTLVACRLAGIPAIGIEQNEQYAEIAANRLRQGVLNFDA